MEKKRGSDVFSVENMTLFVFLPLQVSFLFFHVHK